MSLIHGMSTNAIPFQQIWRIVLRRQFHSSGSAARRESSKVNYKRSKETNPEQILRHDPRPRPAFSRVNVSPKANSTEFVGMLRGKTTLQELRVLLRRMLSPWLLSPSIKQRLLNLGVQTNDCQVILSRFGSYMDEQLTDPDAQSSSNDPWGIFYLSQEEGADTKLLVDRAFTSQLLAFIVNPRSNLDISGETLSSIKQINEALNLQCPSEQYSPARNLRRRIHLHVGPTNSGKTYNALRALSEAQSGVYAGPLRLLAHEVWSRLNLGSIRPFDSPPSAAAQYARQCNLLTGEEQRIVAEDAALTSCTVEMINLRKHYHVAVIDEIQMIADPQRGGSWTAAVLGVCADEVHLCGEETAIPVIEALAAETNDELIIHHYSRLTPLAVADESLHGKWKLIQPGDCVVTFSRKQIFQLKSQVERETGLRCAVVYGRLPPETRSEQAALFNDKHSGYDVLIASDAIGMGLNLKIKRVIFMDLKKYIDMKPIFLSLSQIKQIGGRAGRFGETSGTEQGLVTCMTEEYMPILRKAFSKRTPMLTKAIMPFSIATFLRMAEALPSSYGLKDLYSLLYLGGNLGEHYALPLIQQLRNGMEIIDHVGSDMRLAEKVLFAHCPVTWRMDEEVMVMTKYMQSFMKGGIVDLKSPLESTHFLHSLETINEVRLKMANRSSQSFEDDTIRNKDFLLILETLHKILLSYIWLSFRIPVSFAQQQLAMELKERTEACIEFVLEGIGDRRLLKDLPKQGLAAKEREVDKPKITYTQQEGRGHDLLKKIIESAA